MKYFLPFNSVTIVVIYYVFCLTIVLFFIFEKVLNDQNLTSIVKKIIIAFSFKIKLIF